VTDSGEARLASACSPKEKGVRQRGRRLDGLLTAATGDSPVDQLGPWRVYPVNTGFGFAVGFALGFAFTVTRAVAEL
jgi:hypothetical protein